METIEKKTTNGYIAKINPFLTYDQFQDIQDLYTKGMTFNPAVVDAAAGTEEAKPKMPEIPMSALRDANKKAIEFLLISLVDDKGVEVQRQPGQLPIPLVDGQEVMEEIEKISNEALEAFSKKKVTK